MKGKYDFHLVWPFGKKIENTCQYSATAKLGPRLKKDKGMLKCDV